MEGSFKRVNSNLLFKCFLKCMKEIIFKMPRVTWKGIMWNNDGENIPNNSQRNGI